jgi:hypothetical protein
MESQEIDDSDSLIAKKKIQKWKSVTAHALKNKTEFFSTLKFVDVDGNEVELTTKADQSLLNNIWDCVSFEDDDAVIALNDFYYKIKFNTEQIIDYRKAKGNHIRVRARFAPTRVTNSSLWQHLFSFLYKTIVILRHTTFCRWPRRRDARSTSYRSRSAPPCWRQCRSIITPIA